MQTSYAPHSTMQTATLPNPLAPKPVGAGAFPTSGAVAIGLAVTVGGGVAGGLLAAKLGGKHQKAATIAGTLLGAFVLPMIISPFLVAASTPAAPVAPPAG